MPRKIIATEPAEVIDAVPVDDDNEPLAPLPATPRIKSARPPVGVKTTERHTVERFSEPVAVESDDDDPDELLAANQPIVTTVEEIEMPAVSPIDQLLQTLKDSAECVIYVQRRQDPPGFEFRTPAPQNVSMGPLSWDASFNCKEAIDTALQFAFGGGKYQLQLRVDNVTVKTWTTIVADPPLRQAQRNGGPETPTGYIPAVKSVKEELRETFELWKMLGLTRAQDVAPVDPLTQAQSMVGMMQGFVELGKSMAPPVAAVATGKGSTLETILNAGVAILGTPQGQQIAGGITSFLGAAAMRIVSPAAIPATNRDDAAHPPRVDQGGTSRVNGSVPPAVAGGYQVPDGAAVGGVADAEHARSDPAPPDFSDPATRELYLNQCRQTLAWRIATAIELNRHHGETVQFVLDVLATYPPLADTLRTELRSTMATDPAVILAQLSTMVTHLASRHCDLLAIDTAAGWLESFRDDLLDEPGFTGAGSQEPGAGEEAGPEPVFNMDPDAAVAGAASLGAGSQEPGAGEEAGAVATGELADASVLDLPSSYA